MAVLLGANVSLTMSMQPGTGAEEEDDEVETDDDDEEDDDVDTDDDEVDEEEDDEGGGAAGHAKLSQRLTAWAYDVPLGIPREA